MQENRPELAELTANIVASYVSNNLVAVPDLSALIASVFTALDQVERGVHPGTTVAEPEPLRPAVPIKKSVTAEFVICLEDGKQFKSLKRHLATHYKMTPADYREKWGLPSDYPMVAPAYAAKRSELAKKAGLGQQRKQIEAPVASKPRRKKAAA